MRCLASYLVASWWGAIQLSHEFRPARTTAISRLRGWHRGTRGKDYSKFMICSDRDLKTEHVRILTEWTAKYPQYDWKTKRHVVKMTQDCYFFLLGSKVSLYGAFSRWGYKLYASIWRDAIWEICCDVADVISRSLKLILFGGRGRPGLNCHHLERTNERTKGTGSLQSIWTAETRLPVCNLTRQSQQGGRTTTVLRVQVMSK